MIINENEYGAPWNNQFYYVTFYFTLEQNILLTFGTYRAKIFYVRTYRSIKFKSKEVRKV